MTGRRAAPERRRSTRGRGPWPVRDPFAVLGLEPAAELSDGDVMTAWRGIAAATHPDRADGGDPARFALAAAAYTELRTSAGRFEAQTRLDRGSRLPRFAARALTTGGHDWGERTARPRIAGALVSAVGYVRRGRPARLTARILAAAGGATVAVAAAGHGPAGPALVTGAVTWLLLTARRDLAARGDLPPAHPGERGRPPQPGSPPVATGLAGSADQADQDPT